MKKIAFAGTDGRTLLSALTISTAQSDLYPEPFQGVVVRGTSAMPQMVEMLGWPVTFVPTESNSVPDYADSLIRALGDGVIDYVIPMPEALLFEGIVDAVEAAGIKDRVIGLNKAGSFIEGDKIKCKALCQKAGIPVADAWVEVDARDYESVLSACLKLIEEFGGAVFKYPYSAGGKGARIILNAWQIREVYDTLIKDYKDSYRGLFGKKNQWPLLIESLMSGVEISFTILVDKNGHYQILPTAMDYPERFEGPASKDNPITGGVGAISPHPMETPELIRMAGDIIARPLINAMREMGILRPCIVYPGCFISFDRDMRPKKIRVSEINIRPGEPEAQPVVRRIRNLGALIQATAEGHLDRVEPEVRQDQLSICIALVTGPGGPDGQKGYPWSCTKGEPLEIDFKYIKRKGIQIIPSAMSYAAEDQMFKSDGTRVGFLNANATVKPDQSRGEVAQRLRNKLLAAFDNGKIRVIPREDSEGNRLDIRRDIGLHYVMAEELFTKIKK
jgi:phosphoribosylamine--glycine ligase